VPCVGDEGERVAEDPAGEFHADEHGVERHADEHRPVEVLGGERVVAVAMATRVSGGVVSGEFG
jgi:hypothetical protein